MSESSSEWAFGIKNLWVKMIWLLTCNNLLIIYYMLKKNQATELKYKKVAFKVIPHICIAHPYCA